MSVSCGIPDFRSRDGVYAKLSVEYPDLPDPQAMFDIEYFCQNPRPFFKFAKVSYMSLIIRWSKIWRRRWGGGGGRGALSAVCSTRLVPGWDCILLMSSSFFSAIIFGVLSELWPLRFQQKNNGQ